jgi:endonuclease YncB( thermonuclease family)
VKPFFELFELSQQNKKGLNIYVNGQTIPGIVTHAAGDVVEVKNQQYGRIVIRIDRIDAVAMA